MFLNDDAVIRLIGAVLRGVHEDWQVADRRCLSEGSMALVTNPRTEEIDQTDSPPLSTAWGADRR